MAGGCIKVRGSFAGTWQDMAEGVAFVDGRVKAGTGLQPLSTANGILDRLGRGDAASRVVLDFATA